MILYKEIWRTLDPPLASSRSQVRESADVTKYRANLCQKVLGNIIRSGKRLRRCHDQRRILCDIVHRAEHCRMLGQKFRICIARH